MTGYYRFYEIAKLVRGQGIVLHPERITVDLGSVGPSAITDDVGFRAALTPEAAFWISGGGTLVLRNRYLLLVERPLTTLNNPGKLSLFTGRADSREEWFAPQSLMRELFEELILMADGCLIRPMIPERQEIVDAACRAAVRAGVAAEDRPLSVPFHPVALPTRRVEIRDGARCAVHDLCCHMNSNGDVNVLFAFSADLDPARLTARDGEYHKENGRIVLHDRTIVLYDTQTSTIRPLSRPGPETPVDPSTMMTEHLLALLKALKLYRSD